MLICLCFFTCAMFCLVSGVLEWVQQTAIIADNILDRQVVSCGAELFRAGDISGMKLRVSRRAQTPFQAVSLAV